MVNYDLIKLDGSVCSLGSEQRQPSTWMIVQCVRGQQCWSLSPNLHRELSDRNGGRQAARCLPSAILGIDQATTSRPTTETQPQSISNYHWWLRSFHQKSCQIHTTLAFPFGQGRGERDEVANILMKPFHFANARTFQRLMLNLALCALLILTTYARIKKHLLSMGTPELIIEVLKGAMNYLSLQTHQNSLEWQMSSAWATPIIISGITLPLHQRFNRHQPLLFITVAFSTHWINSYYIHSGPQGLSYESRWH